MPSTRTRLTKSRRLIKRMNSSSGTTTSTVTCLSRAIARMTNRTYALKLNRRHSNSASTPFVLTYTTSKAVLSMWDTTRWRRSSKSMKLTLRLASTSTQQTQLRKNWRQSWWCKCCRMISSWIIHNLWSVWRTEWLLLKMTLDLWVMTISVRYQSYSTTSSKRAWPIKHSWARSRKYGPVTLLKLWGKTFLNLITPSWWSWQCSKAFQSCLDSHLLLKQSWAKWVPLRPVLKGIRKSLMLKLHLALPNLRHSLKELQNQVTSGSWESWLQI